MAEHQTLVVGGTGAIGRHVARFLADTGHSVLLSSREAERAGLVARHIVGARPVVIDTTNDQLELPSGVELVVDCTGTEQTAVAQAAASAGADLIDVSATTTHLRALADLDHVFTKAGRRAIIGVGLAPGLSTLLAQSVHDSGSPGPITINGILDTRDEHGPGSAAFTIGKIGTDFADPTTGALVRNFTGLQRPDLPAGFGKRIVARADFPDQHTLTSDLGVRVTTNYGFTSSITTLAVTVATRLPKIGPLLNRIASIIPRPTGTGPYLITAQTTRRISWATGTGQARGTAALAQLAADRLTTSSGLDSGVHTLNKMMTLDAETLADLAHHGIAVAAEQ